MNREEKYLRQRFGSETPFRVPEDYFKDFSLKMMEQLPVVASASVCAVIFGAGLFYNNHYADPVPAYTTAKATAVETNIDQAADYVMIDNEDIYSYLADY